MARSPHPNKEVEKVLPIAENNGWRVVQGGSHAWAKFTVRTRILNVAVASFVLPASGAHPLILTTMPGPF